MVSVIFLLLACVLVVRAAESPIRNDARDEPYLKEFIPELQVKWPDTRILNIVCLGDSITAGFLDHPKRTRTRCYAGLLATWLEEKFPYATFNVINSGVAGDTTAGGLARLQRDVLDHHPEMVTICYGMNDFLKLPLDRFEANLRQMVDRLRVAKIRWLVLMTTMPRSTGQDKQKTYMEVVAKVAKDARVGFADVFAQFEPLLAKQPASTIWSDPTGCHPTYDGHKLYLKPLIVLFEQALSGQGTKLGK